MTAIDWGDEVERLTALNNSLCAQLRGDALQARERWLVERDLAAAARRLAYALTKLLDTVDEARR